MGWGNVMGSGSAVRTVGISGLADQVRKAMLRVIRDAIRSRNRRDASRTRRRAEPPWIRPHPTPNRWIRSFLHSVTHTAPFPSTAMPRG